MTEEIKKTKKPKTTKKTKVKEVKASSPISVHSIDYTTLIGLADNVVVTNEIDKTPAERADITYFKGTVISKGPNCSKNVKVGDVVYFIPFSFQIIGEGDKSVIVIREINLLAKQPNNVD